MLRIATLAAGILLALGALLHLAIPLGGPEWYRFFGAPPELVAMAAAGESRPWITCVAIAAFLVALSAYAFSGAGLLRPLPVLRWVLCLSGLGLLARGLLFLPVAMWRPALLARLCGNCAEVNPFLILTSLLCVLIGLGLLAAAMQATSRSAAGPRI
jgi:hypothetical protein